MNYLQTWPGVWSVYRGLPTFTVRSWRWRYTMSVFASFLWRYNNGWNSLHPIMGGVFWYQTSVLVSETFLLETAYYYCWYHLQPYILPSMYTHAFAKATFNNLVPLSFVSSPSVSPMGGSSSRLYSSLAQSLNSAPLAQTDQDLDHDLVETDPDQLLRECEEALQRRPARPHRDLVYLNSMGLSHHKHSSMRIMQWNILAQGNICV